MVLPSASAILRKARQKGASSDTEVRWPCSVSECFCGRASDIALVEVEHARGLRSLCLLQGFFGFAAAMEGGVLARQFAFFFAALLFALLA